MEMKKVWTRPLTMVQAFEANESVAACGDSGTVYKFQCNAPAGTLYGPKLYPWEWDQNGDGYVARGSFSPCPAYHEANSTDVFEDGFIDYNDNGVKDDGEAVIIWDYEHATKDLDMNQWETAKS